MQLVRRVLLSSSLLLTVLLLFSSAQAGVASAAASTRTFHRSVSNKYNAGVAMLRQMKNDGRLAPSVQVLDSLPPTTIVQFPLVPSGIKNAFPQATGLVTIVRGDCNNALYDTVIVDVQ